MKFLYKRKPEAGPSAVWSVILVVNSGWYGDDEIDATIFIQGMIFGIKM